ncbi:centrosomal protein of 170 kDa protein B isoform X2 [Brachyhypopomus gauderio]|uniref:centrosomal protein of 170 kDa protein B isoform X2 n=1 Tax=Brachyhypopomus gauderio TaxID=698409 RepID=UPI004042DDDC
MSVTSWFLVSSSGTRHRLPREMIFVGREDCELMLQSRSVDKQHAVINYDPATDEHLVKDLGSLNGTFVNDLRIPDQTYITLKLSDVVRFGYDSHVYIMERSQHKVPEEALKHEKYTSQLQMGVKAQESGTSEQAEEKSSSTDLPHSKLDKGERKAPADPPLSKPTPLYGQPSWWGDVDEENTDQQSVPNDHGNSEENQKEDSRHDVSRSSCERQNGQDRSIYSYQRDVNYLEIPAMELQSKTKTAASDVQVIPTKDTNSRPPSTPPVVQSHASFTIEFDDCTPGKMKIKDHVTKFSFRQRKTPSKDSIGTPTEVMSAQSKVADWLVQSNSSMMKRASQTEDLYKTKSDHSMHKESLKDRLHHEDRTQSETENFASNTQEVSTSECSPPQPFTPPERGEPLISSTPCSQSQGKLDPQQAFVIELFDDNARKKRSHSFTNNMSPPESHVVLKGRIEKKGSPLPGEQSAPSTAHNPPTQQFSVPLKTSDGPQRSGSLRREKTDIHASTSNFSSRSGSLRMFGSIGRKSKLTQDFQAEFLGVSKPNSLATWEKHTSTSLPAPSTLCMVEKDPPTTSLPPIPSINRTRVSSPPLQEVSSKPLFSPTSPNGTDAKHPKEEDDSLSDAGTYTIEAEGPDKELEEAHNKIDQVFGVRDCPERSSQPSAATVYRPVEGDREGKDSLQLSESSPGPVLGQHPGCGDPAKGPAQESVALATVGPRWVSHWTGLADSYSDSSSLSGTLDIPTKIDQRGGHIVQQSGLARNLDSAELDSSHSLRTRRILPQLPNRERLETSTLSIHIQSDSCPTYDGEERNIGGSCPKEGLQNLHVHDDLDPDSLSESDEGSIVNQGRQISDQRTNKSMLEIKTRTPSKQDHIFTSGEAKIVMDQDSTPRYSTATITRQYGSQKYGKSNSSPEKDSSQNVESSVPLIRQESFTKERSSDDINFMRLPHISTPLSSNDSNAFKAVCSQDTQSYLKETENVLATLEAKLKVQKNGSLPLTVEDSLSGESDVDTSSTVSQRSGRNAAASIPKKPVILNELLKKKKNSSQQAQEQTCFQSTGDASSQFSRTGSAEHYKGDSAKDFKLHRSSGKRGSQDFGSESRSSTTRQLPETVSDQESSSRPAQKKYTISLQKDKSSKSIKNTLVQALSRSHSLSAPKPTRTSMLRRGRLEEASDNDGTEANHPSQNSDAKPSSSKPHDSKKLSRLDILALPRKRTGSFTTPSDTESSTDKTGFSNRSMGSGFSVRKASVPDLKTSAQSAQSAQKGSGLTGKQPIIRGRSSSAKYLSSTMSSRRHQKGSDYTSTSEEEYESNHSTPKHKRSHHSGALHTSRTQNLGPVRALPRTRDSEEEGHEHDAFQNWTTHSAEIARLSQDLAKDLAILAREIHNVAGDEPQSSAAPDTTELVPATPVNDELEHQILESSPNHPKIAQSSVGSMNSDQTITDQGFKQHNWSQEQVAINNGMLNPVSQVSMAIRENTEQLTEKLKLLFHNKSDVWREIEAEVNAADDCLPLESPNKEIMSILRELKGIQKRLEVMNAIIEPSGKSDLMKSLMAGGHSATWERNIRSSPKDWRPPSSQQGGGPSASCRRLGRESDGDSVVV